MPAAPDVSVVITNYNTGAYLERCVASILAQDLGSRRCEVVVVENASFVDQEPHLRVVESMGARVLRQTTNLGHGRGCNRGLQNSSGDFVFFVNSDTVACPGAVGTLVDCLVADPEAGLVEPRTFFDDDRAFRIHEVPTPTPWATTLMGLSQWSERLSLRLSLAQTRRSLRGWLAQSPLSLPHLTGAFLGSRRAVLERLGGYDEGYPLYYEDSDLFLRVRKLGLRLLLVPGADVIHYGHRSVVQTWNEAIAKARIGRARYMTLHHGRLARWWDQGIHWFAQRMAPRQRRPRPAPIDLGTLAVPPTFAPAIASTPWLLEITIDPSFALSEGHICHAPAAPITPRSWQSLYPTTYFARAVDMKSWRVRGSWRFTRAG